MSSSSSDGGGSGIAPPMWQAAVIGGLMFTMYLSSFFNLTIRFRSLIQPCVLYHVLSGDSLILRIQVFLNFIYLFYLLFFELLVVIFLVFLCCRNTSTDIWTSFSQHCLVLYLFLSTLHSFRCSSGYAHLHPHCYYIFMIINQFRMFGLVIKDVF